MGTARVAHDIEHALGWSAPESLVQQVIERLRALSASDVKEMAGKVETTAFRLPEELARK